MKMPTPMMKPAGMRSSKPHLRMQKIHLTGKSAFPQGPAAFNAGPAGAPDPGAAFPPGDGGDGAAGGDTGE